jgi:hypothetical protein
MRLYGEDEKIDKTMLSRGRTVLIVCDSRQTEQRNVTRSHKGSDQKKRERERERERERRRVGCDCAVNGRANCPSTTSKCPVIDEQVQNKQRWQLID